MKNESTLADLVESAALASVAEKLGQTDGGFCEMAASLNLDRKYDFRFSNLERVDFSYSDLRGFDFRGADLRNSFGAQVVFDDTTNFDGADLMGSCFATYQREKEVFQSNNRAVAGYQLLKSGNTFEVSGWIHSQFGSQESRQRFLKDVDDETAAILCQKLMSDDIDLTKRTDLFHFLNEITGSQTALRELILNIFARHLDNTVTIESFISVAGKLYKNDPVIFDALRILCDSKSERIREAAFRVVAGTKRSAEFMEVLHGSFLKADNIGIRKRLIRQTAIALGRNYLTAVTKNASANVDGELDVLDVDQLLTADHAAKIASTISQREHENIKRLEPERWRPVLNGASRQQVSSVLDRQEEVLSVAPIIKRFFAWEQPARARAARNRVKSKLKNRSRFSKPGASRY